MNEHETLVGRVRQALLLTDGQAELHPHTSWEVCEMLTRLKPSDFTVGEMMAMAVILANVHARTLGPRGPNLSLAPERREYIGG